MENTENLESSEVETETPNYDDLPAVDPSNLPTPEAIEETLKGITEIEELKTVFYVEAKGFDAEVGLSFSMPYGILCQLYNKQTEEIKAEKDLNTFLLSFVGKQAEKIKSDVGLPDEVYYKTYLSTKEVNEDDILRPQEETSEETQEEINEEPQEPTQETEKQV